jgi:hypothetical protein
MTAISLLLLLATLGAIATLGPTSLLLLLLLTPNFFSDVSGNFFFWPCVLAGVFYCCVVIDFKRRSKPLPRSCGDLCRHYLHLCFPSFFDKVQEKYYFNVDFSGTVVPQFFNGGEPVYQTDGKEYSVQILSQTGCCNCNKYILRGLLDESTPLSDAEKTALCERLAGTW